VVDHLEARELRYFMVVAEELHFGRAANRLGMTQPPLSRAIQRLERHLGAELFSRDRHGVTLTEAGQVLLDEGRVALDALASATRRARRAASSAGGRLVLAVKAAGSHQLMRRLLSTYAADPGAVPVDVLLCRIGEQERLLRDGHADAALLHSSFNSTTGFDVEEIAVEDQVVILPAEHPLATNEFLKLADVVDVPDLPLARWPRSDGTYPPGPGPAIREQSQVGQLIALGRTLAVLPRSATAWLWAEHAAVPLIDAPPVSTFIAWPSHSRSVSLANLVRTAVRLADS
jgi:DNA-binding transcriptional LysR family regulator